jgi:hypothetical protein
MIHVMTAAGLDGAPVAAPVVGNHGRSPCRGRTNLEAAKGPNIVVSGTESCGFDATPIVTWSLILGITRNLQVEAAGERCHDLLALSLPVPSITSWRAEIDGKRFSEMIEITVIEPGYGRIRNFFPM